MLPAVVIPKEAGEPAASASLVTRFSQIDINGHMNNTRYFDMIDDLLKKDCDGSADIAVPKKVLANYLSELKLGDEFTLDQYSNADTLFFEGGIVCRRHTYSSKIFL